MPRHLIIKIARGVTTFPDDDTYHAEELPPPTGMPDADLIKVEIAGNVVVHWWQVVEPAVTGTILRAAAAAGASPRGGE